MKIITSYTIKIKKQMYAYPEEKDGKTVLRSGPVNKNLIDRTSETCLSALKLCVKIFLSEWDYLSAVPAAAKKGRLNRTRAADILVHSTKKNTAKYPEFDKAAPYMPAYMRRAIIADALGMVSSYVSNHKDREALSPKERSAEPKIGFPNRYELTFYRQERDLDNMEKGLIGLKLFDGKTWNWYYFRVSPADAKYINKVSKEKKLLSPVIEKTHKGYRIRFSFEEEQELVQNDNPTAHRILAVDLGINAPASWSIMSADGTVHAKGVVHLRCEEDRLRHLINRKRMYQQAGKKSKSIFRMIRAANKQLAVNTCKALIRTAVRHNVDCIIFEHLSRSGSVKGKKYRERIHLWRAADVQRRVELQAHRHGMRISRVCAWGTSRLAFDGSGKTERGIGGSYSICRFRSGKIYNCDLSASLNIGARYFLRAYSKQEDCPELPKVPQRTLSTLLNLKFADKPAA